MSSEQGARQNTPPIEASLRPVRKLTREMVSGQDHLALIIKIQDSNGGISRDKRESVVDAVLAGLHIELTFELKRRLQRYRVTHQDG